MWEQACLSELLAPASLEAWGQSHTPEETQCILQAERERCKMADIVRVYPMPTWLPELQEVTLVDTGVRLELREGFTLMQIEETERLCLLCPGCRRPTDVVSAWIQCGHCNEPLIKLTPSEQERGPAVRSMYGKGRLQAELGPMDADWEEWSLHSSSEGEWE